MSAENNQAKQTKSDIEQAVDNIKVDSLAENLKDSADNTNTAEVQKPATLSDDEQTAFIDEELRTDQ
ncbi:hypothetical protein [Psychrobacter sp. I-STPA10]|uniref:hypothetical protein n=1 Tax=Psychrobacter sp. I-STPA10 TaxID=2585769 RepID=UPI001E318D45|nr:hypothetical protein [Psychrobacter sp. I-STPA10]